MILQLQTYASYDVFDIIGYDNMHRGMYFALVVMQF